MNNFRPKFDKINATYAWRLRLLPEYDTRINKIGSNIFEGYSKYIDVPEDANKKDLLIKCCSMLFAKKWVHKSDGVLIYKADTYMKLPIGANKCILQILPDNGLWCFKYSELEINKYQLQFIEKMVESANSGLVQILKVVK
jgi:hypothetical protein